VTDLDSQPPPRIGLRGDPVLDDVFVKGVSMFRAEMLDQGRLWTACYLPGTGVDGDRITFEVAAHGQRLEFSVIERPVGTVVAE
jgi:hypothetical protein